MYNTRLVIITMDVVSRRFIETQLIKLNNNIFSQNYVLFNRVIVFYFFFNFMYVSCVYICVYPVAAALVLCRREGAIFFI